MYLSIAEVCDVFGISRPTEACWRAKGILPKPLKMERRVYYRRSDIEGLQVSASEETKII